MSTQHPDRKIAGMLPEANHRQQSVTSDWRILRRDIDGVVLKAIRSVMKGNGSLTERLSDSIYGNRP